MNQYWLPTHKIVGMEVVGYYQACERLDDTAPALVGEKVEGEVKAAFEGAVAFVVRFCPFVVDI